MKTSRQQQYRLLCLTTENAAPWGKEGERRERNPLPTSSTMKQKTFCFIFNMLCFLRLLNMSRRKHAKKGRPSGMKICKIIWWLQGGVVLLHASPLHTCTRWVSNWIAHLIAVFLLNVDHSGAVSVPCALQPHVERKISSCSRVGSCKASHYSRPNAEIARIQNRCFMCRKNSFQFAHCQRFEMKSLLATFATTHSSRTSCFSAVLSHAMLLWNLPEIFTDVRIYERGNSRWMICNRQSVEWEGWTGGWRSVLEVLGNAFLLKMFSEVRVSAWMLMNFQPFSHFGLPFQPESTFPSLMIENVCILGIFKRRRTVLENFDEFQSFCG